MRHAIARDTRALMYLGWLIFLRDFRYRYRQTYLGPLWAVSRLLFAGLPIILVGNQFDLGAGRTPVAYAPYALTGFILWQVFWDGVLMPQWIGRRMRKTMIDTAFRQEALIVAAGWYTAFNISIYLTLLAVVFVIFRVVPPLTLALGLLALPVLMVAGLSIGGALVPLTYVYLDFRYGLPFLSTFLLWTAPIFYVMPDSGILRTINVWNPLTYLIDIPRYWFVGGLFGNDLLFIPYALAFAALFMAGLRFYRRSMPLALQCVALN